LEQEEIARAQISYLNDSCYEFHEFSFGCTKEAGEAEERQTPTGRTMVTFAMVEGAVRDFSVADGRSASYND